MDDECRLVHVHVRLLTAISPRGLSVGITGCGCALRPGRAYLVGWLRIRLDPAGSLLDCAFTRCLLAQHHGALT